jgi:hypothetical protein
VQTPPCIISLSSCKSRFRIESILAVFLERLRTKAFLFSLAAACIPAFLLEPLAEHALSQSSEASHQSIFDLHNIYRKRVTVGWRGEPTPNFTAIIEIRGGREPGWIGFTSVCTQRLFLSYLIRKLDLARPQMIVIDKYFSATACPEGDFGTQKLLAAVREVSATTPILIGTTDERIDPREDSADQRYSLTLGLRFSDGVEGRIREGNIRLSPDTRTIPLRWHVFRDSTDVRGHYVNSLALETALTRAPDLIERHRALGRVIANHRFPFTSLITTVPIDVVPAGAFMFGSTAVGPPSTWNDTIGREPDSSFVDRLRGRIVFVGENQPNIDQWTTESGVVPGVVLQANYVESLLDGRYFEPVAWYWNIIAGLIVFFCFHLLLILAEEVVAYWKLQRPIHLLLAATAAVTVVAGSFLVLAACVLIFGLYIDPLNLSLAAMWVSVLHVLFYKVEHSEGRKQAAPTS